MAENVHEHTDGHSAFARAPRKKWDGEGQEPSVPPSSWNEGPTSVCACLARWYLRLRAHGRRGRLSGHLRMAAGLHGKVRVFVRMLRFALP